MPVSVSLDYSPNPVRSWASFMCSQEWCMTWARSRNIAKSPQIDNWFQGAIYADKSQWDREATGHWSSSMQTGPHLPWIQEVIRAGRQLVYQNAQSFPFSLLSTQDVPIRKKKCLKTNPTAHLRDLLLRRKNPCITTSNPHSSQLHTTSFSFSYQHHFVVEIVISLQKEKGRGEQ